MGATTKRHRSSAARPLRDYRTEAQVAIDRLIARGDPFTADSVRMEMPEDVKDAHHNVLPALISSARKAGRIVRVGSVRSPNRSRKGGWNALWLAAE